MKKQEAIDLFGTQAALARFFKISKGAVSQWGEEIPPLRALQIKTSKKKRRSEQAA